MRFESSRSNPSGTLIIESVGEGEGALAVKGKYGSTGQNLSRINGTLETSGGQARLRFTTSANANVVLDLREIRISSEPSYSQVATGVTCGSRRLNSPCRRFGSQNLGSPT